MSGHSKWATTKHKKAAIDAKRGKLFAKLIKNIEIAAKAGGPDPDGNPTLFDAILKAKKQSVPNDNIERARKRGGGLEAGGADYTTIMYEVYGTAGVALLVECLTDNKNRAAMEVRTAVTRNGGTMADPGSVSWLFSTTTTPLRVNSRETEPGSAMVPPLRVTAVRTSMAARFLLSVRHSTSSATPPGAYPSYMIVV